MITVLIISFIFAILIIAVVQNIADKKNKQYLRAIVELTKLAKVELTKERTDVMRRKFKNNTVKYYVKLNESESVKTIHEIIKLLTNEDDSKED